MKYDNEIYLTLNRFSVKSLNTKNFSVGDKELSVLKMHTIGFEFNFSKP